MENGVSTRIVSLPWKNRCSPSQLQSNVERIWTCVSIFPKRPCPWWWRWCPPNIIEAIEYRSVIGYLMAVGGGSTFKFLQLGWSLQEAKDNVSVKQRPNRMTPLATSGHFAWESIFNGELIACTNYICDDLRRSSIVVVWNWTLWAHLNGPPLADTAQSFRPDRSGTLNSVRKLRKLSFYTRWSIIVRRRQAMVGNDLHASFMFPPDDLRTNKCFLKVMSEQAT